MNKMRLSLESKAARKAMKAELKMADGVIFTNGDVTVAISWCKNVMGEFGNMVYVGVSYTHPNDEFNRKYGEYFALARWRENMIWNKNQLRVPDNVTLQEFVDYTFFNLAY